MRLFIEAELEASALDEVWSAGQRMGAEPGFPAGALRWVKREAMHLTLRFLGELDEALLADIGGALSRLEGGGGFDLRMVEVGTFGGRRPRVVWVGFADDEGYAALQDLRRGLDDLLAEIGLAAERGTYRPHLTLGRVRRQANRDDQAAIRAAVRAAPPPDIAVSVTSLALVESTLLSDGPRYRRLAMTEL